MVKRHIPEGVKEIPVAKVKVGMFIAPDHGKVTKIAKVTRRIVDVIGGKIQPERVQNFIVLSFASNPDRWHLADDKTFQRVKAPAPVKKVKPTPDKPAKAGRGEFSKARSQS